MDKLDDDPAFQEYNDKILNTIDSLTANGKSKNTLRSVQYSLRILNREADLMNPEAVKLAIGKLNVSNQTKQKHINNYGYFCKANNIEWERPVYKWDAKTPIVPSKHNVEAIISAATLKTATIFTIMAETALEGAELHNVKRKDIDTEQGIISVSGNKGHRGGSYKLRQKTAEMLRTYLTRYTSEQPFPRSQIMGESWRNARARAAQRLNKPELLNIPLKSLRNYSAAQLYYAIQDPWRVMLHLRHKKLDTTQHYIQGMTVLGDPEYQTVTAATLQEYLDLLDKGYTYISDYENLKVLRKRK